eukprot:gnl/TRDRNA2_/TRDRNA2_57701_c0_seq1.p1 gnl/TRDRNA2_/TRDRNA2_57701_c0~~gnl/TRDRNA2_/TRDRNA2_57701_c0_seq1.p1  ORF type:complete len:338 (+),score=58.23 gnl/TRDRNA2_/TRDRNA2_57701_c0_seq1:45-1016(+)
MPNRGKMADAVSKENDLKMVTNLVKRVLDINCVSKCEKQKIEKPIRRVAHQVLMLMRKHEGATDLGRILDELALLEIHARDGLQTQVPKTLGRDHGRQILEELLGSTAQDALDPTVEYVYHGDKPGKPAPVDLNYASDEDVPERTFGADSESSASFSGSEDEAGEEASSANAASSLLPSAIHLLEFKRSPKELLEALRATTELAECRYALERHGFDGALKGGAKVFVRPELYTLVVNAVKGRNLKPRHIIIAEELEASLMNAIEDIGKGVTAKAKTPIHQLLVKRTFIHIDIPSSLRSEPKSDPVTFSTTDGNPRVPFQPRRV